MAALGQERAPQAGVAILHLGETAIQVPPLRAGLGPGERPVQVGGVRLILEMVLPGSEGVLSAVAGAVMARW